MSWEAVVEAGGEVGHDLERVNWDTTPLGPPTRWPDGLLNVLRVMLSSRFSMWMAWGPELTFFCNDAYRRDTLGSKYPWALGRPASEVWGEIWDDIGPRIERVLGEGEATWDESLLLYLERSGYREETYHTFSYSPLADDFGQPVGMLCVVAEETDKVIAERRLRTLRDVAAELAGATEQEDVFRRLTTTLERDRVDLPFTLTYLLGQDGGARLVTTTGIPASVRTEFDRPAHGTDWPPPRRYDGAVVVEADQFPPWLQKLGPALGDAMPERALLVPLRAQPEIEPIGYFVAGLTPHRPADENMVSFVRLLTDQIDSAIKTVRALETAELRAEALAELDRVKTQFFANISHEFRTPLTLILGPLDRLRSVIASEGPPALMADVDAMQANALRLSRLVTDVLDFSRLQAGKLLAAHEPVDLGLFTSDLAEMFRPTIELVGLRFVVECDDVGLVDVDPSMWERIVLNLLSNALKFTFSGEICLNLADHGHALVLTVADTGVGIPEAEVPKLFERFHRVERSRARSSEGTGIGLALVSELTALHDGRVSVSSTLEVGTTFTVSIPVRRSVQPGEPMPTLPTRALQSMAPAAFLAETARWATDGASGSDSGSDSANGDGAAPAGGRPASRSQQGGAVLVVDDNADMRDYLVRLLGSRFQVRTASNGAEALASIEADPPDLIVSDVMMPLVDGVELVRRIRSQPELADLPVILLTAAAGTTATAEGLDVGADDYLVKPFTAENLLMRVSARLSAGHDRRRRTAMRELTAALAAQPTPEDVLAMVYPFLQTWLQVAATSLAVADDRSDSVRLWHRPGYGGGVGERYRAGTRSSPAPAFDAIRLGQTIVLEDVDAIVARYADAGPQCRAAGIGALLVAPLRTATGAVRGSLLCTWSQPRPLLDHEIELFEATARIVADVVERILATAQEHRFLSEFQERLLEIDHRSTLAVVSVTYRPSQRNSLVGGDWYDIVTLAEGSVGVTIGDVVGSGLLAATSMSQLRSAARLAAMSSSEPSHVLTMLDAFTLRSPAAQCASAIYARLLPDGRLHWSSAGHPPPLLLTGPETVFLTEGLRPLLGVGDGDQAAEAEIQLPPASTLLLYTDGLVERRGESLDEGLQRLAGEAAALSHLSVGRLSDELLKAMTPPGGLRDDVALITLRTTGSTPERFIDAFHSHSSSLAAARHRFREWLVPFGLEAPALNDLILAFGEVIANAVEHGNHNDGEQVVGVEAICEGMLIEVSVTDSGSWSDSTISHRRGRGRGFTIINALAERLDVSTSRVGTTVSFAFSFSAAG